jgi:hypothetical protein
MISSRPAASGPILQPTPAADRLIPEPFLHLAPGAIYNTLTDRTLRADDPAFGALRTVLDGERAPIDLPPAERARLVEEGWLIESAADLLGRFRLKYVSFEASTVCNQACYFCPVSIAPREAHAMSMEFYEQICGELAAHRATLEGVSMIHYNEPTADKRFLDQIRVLKRHGLPPAVLTNATGLTPARVDEILALGGLAYLSINLSTLDRERYRRDRGGDHLPIVLRNLDYCANLPLAPQMDMAVLGTGDEVHRRDFEAIHERFAGTRFNVQFYEVMDRAGAVPVGLKPERTDRRLRGCEQTGSRPVQWVHITPHGKCVLCCQDYSENYVIGDLHEESLDSILSGPRMSMLRGWVYGIEEAPDDFICRHCIYALTE